MTHTEILEAQNAQTMFTEAIGNASEINELLRRYGVKFAFTKTAFSRNNFSRSTPFRG